MARRRYTSDEQIPGAFEGETVSRRRFMTLSAHSAGAVAGAAITIPVLGFAVGPIFRRLPVMWQPVGPVDEFPENTYVIAVIRLTPDAIGEANKSTVFVRRRNPAIDTEPIDRFSHFIAISSRCVHVGCPVSYKDAAKAFVCPCHGGVYDFRGLRVGGPRGARSARLVLVQLSRRPRHVGRGTPARAAVGQPGRDRAARTGDDRRRGVARRCARRVGDRPGASAVAAEASRRRRAARRG